MTTSNEIKLLIKYGEKAGKTLRAFTEQLNRESNKAYKILCNMDVKND